MTGSDPAFRDRPTAPPGDDTLVALAERADLLDELLLSDEIERLAVLATFDPDTQARTTSIDIAAMICDRLGDPRQRGEWMLKERHRIDTLARMAVRGGRDALRTARASATEASAGPLQGVLDVAIAGHALDIAALDEDHLIAALRVGRWFMEAEAVSGMRDLTPPGFEPEPIEGRLALIETLRPIHAITADGCVGRQLERDRLAEHLEGPGTDMRLVDYPALVVYGVGGVGKSTLMARFVLDVVERTGEPWAWAYLDLDRPSLSSYQPAALCNDIIRQVGAQLPEARRYLDRSSVVAKTVSRGRGLEGTYDEAWRESIPGLGQAVNDVYDGRLVVIVDTYEELQRSERTDDPAIGETLHRMFNTISDYTRRFRLVVSGRAPAPTFMAWGTADTAGTADPPELLHVESFAGEAAIEVLRHHYRREISNRPSPPADTEIDTATAQAVVDTVGGSPLTLKLAARVLAAEGDGAMSDVLRPGLPLDRVRDEFIRGFLYHRVLDHLVGRDSDQTEPLRAVARASLPLRVVTTDLLRSVVLPAVGRHDVDAGHMLEALRVETALADEIDGGLRLRDELRTPALRALRFDDPVLVDDVHRRAAAHYEEHPELPGASSELLYHSLAGGGHVDATTDAAALRGIERSLADLPADTRHTAAAAIGDTRVLNEVAARHAQERRRQSDAERAIDEGRLDDAAAALDGEEAWSATTTLHRLVARLHEARGDLDQAAEAAGRDVAAMALTQQPGDFASAALRHAELEERRLHGAEGARILHAADATAWLSGHVAVRLELQLNALAMLERSGSDADRWTLELDARALLQRMPATELRSNTALVRLQAATLGRDEPTLILEAVRVLGVGVGTYSTHLRTLAQALAEWDGTDDTGSIARSMGLHPASPSATDLAEAWFQGLSGLSSDAPFLLDQAFSARTPSPAVFEALRAIYLWWNLDPQRLQGMEAEGEGPPVEQPDGESHFLDGAVDFSDRRIERLVGAIAGAYPTGTLLRLLASRVGLDPDRINWRLSSERLTRDILVEASRNDRLDALVAEFLRDPSTSSFHPEVRDIVGDPWLQNHNIA